MRPKSIVMVQNCCLKEESYIFWLQIHINGVFNDYHVVTHNHQNCKCLQILWISSEESSISRQLLCSICGAYQLAPDSSPKEGKPQENSSHSQSALLLLHTFVLLPPLSNPLQTQRWPREWSYRTLWSTPTMTSRSTRSISTPSLSSRLIALCRS